MKKFYKTLAAIWICAATYTEIIGSISLGDYGIIVSLMMILYVLIEKEK